MKSEDCLQKPKHVVWKEIDGKGILLNLESGSYFEVSPVGLDIWKRLDGNQTLENVSNDVARMFSENPERVAKDIRRFAQELVRRRLVETKRNPASRKASNTSQ